jgi:hypothetical protein
MEENSKKNIVNHFEAGSNCQVFNGNITGCTFAMPGSTVTQQAAVPVPEPQGDTPPEVAEPCNIQREPLFHFIHPAVDSRQEWQIHDEVKHLVARQGIQEICHYLKLMVVDRKILLPQSPSIAYEELVRMGMPSGSGFNEKTFQKYYRMA